MSLLNGYVSVVEFKDWATQRGQDITVDAIDDKSVEIILDSACRYMDTETGRHFYPLYQTQLYDIPGYLQHYHTDELLLTDDLLALTTLTNGDGSVITSTDYILKSVNNPPYWAIRIRDVSNITWQTNAASSAEQVLSVNGLWGYHDQYATRAWSAVDTLSAAITDTTSLTMTCAGNAIRTNDIFKIDSELFNAVSANSANGAIIVNKRGDNGSTAATHSNGATLYRWNTMQIVRSSVLAIALGMYQERSGQASGGKVTVTAAGVVIRPEDVPPMAQKVIYDLKRYS